MGGYGSTRWGWHYKKQTVENSLKLTVLDVLKCSIPLKTSGRRGGFLTWKRRDHIVGSVTFALDLQVDNPVLMVKYSANGQPHNYAINLTTTPCRYGGVRYWFSCPRCKRRCGCLYLPLTQSNSTRFYCRKCHDLTYTSSQEAHHYDRLGRSLGINFAALDKAFELERIADKWFRKGRLTKSEKWKLKAWFAEKGIED
jgi:hypothetical protein